jgi:hypothetical protein
VSLLDVGERGEQIGIVGELRDRGAQQRLGAGFGGFHSAVASDCQARARSRTSCSASAESGKGTRRWVTGTGFASGESGDDCAWRGMR